MKLTIILIIVSLSLISCISTKKLMNSWVGDSKQNLVLKWGPPTRIASDANNGEIYIYERQYMAYGGVVRYDHKMFYIHSDDKIYFWRTESGPIPAQQMNVNLYVR